MCFVRAFLSGLSLSVAFAASATAADVQGFDWSGLYVGGHASYARGRANNTLFDPAASGSGKSFGSLYGGLQAGYNYQLPSGWLLGVEADVSFPNFLEDGLIGSRATAQSASVTDQIDYIATLRGRIGYTFGHWLIYGTGGYAWSQARLVETPGVTLDADKTLPMRTGWTAGMGTEVAVAPDWTARLEYLYDRFGSVTGAFPSGTQYASAFDIHMLRFGLNYKLGWSRTDAPAATIAPTDAWPSASDNWNIHGQFTLIGQGYPAFRSPYEGPQSLSGASQFKNTTSATAFVGVRAWEGGEIYINPELMQGFGLGNTFGAAGFPNGEAQKSNFPMGRFNIARAYLRQTFGLGGEQEAIADGPNQLGGKQDISRISITAGKMSVIDFFDNNAFSHDPRRDFLNWNMYCCGSYDLTMDKISYTWGAFAELNQKQWAVRLGYFLVPTVSNDNTFDTHIPDRGEYIGELELRYSLFQQPGKLRLMGWANRATAGSYSEAVALPISSTNYPDITLTRKVRTNYGFVANLEQAVTADLGFVARASWDAGQTEKIGWTDCDRSLSLGAVLKGSSWDRPDDKIGIGGVIEGLSPEARAYFAAGGLGILIGDGGLNYRQEKVFETYYAYSLNKWTTFTLDYQLITNPAYNADRGPISILAGRLHAEF
ncbi:carbohydrate porin [Bradyrhizobium genosp. A]|uniref:carbohydrate porin n=1 Tax=Bradyrhizobium genosp. A TaxID=83626 RepID=UPI003CF06147